MQWSGLWSEEYGCLCHHAAAADHRHFDGIRSDASDHCAHCSELQGNRRLGGSYTYGTTNNKLVDISPSGNICAGTWNRNSGGGIADYTICNYPSPLPNSSGLPYSTAFITASADSVVSNPVTVYVHAQVSSISLVGPQSCLSQGQLAQLDAEACYSSGGTQYELCAPSTVTNYACAGKLAPGVSSVPNCSSVTGPLTYSAGTASVASINADDQPDHG